MNTFFKNLKKIEETVIVVLMVIMCVIIFLATLARFTNLFIISWAEELARYCMIWIIFIGISIAAQNGEHYCVQALNLFLPQKALHIIRIICTVFVIGFNILASYYGIFIVRYQMESSQITPSLNWPMWLIYLAIPVGLTLMAVQYTYNTWLILKGKTDDTDKEVEV